jgi:autotransporter-associated beta strand protein
MIRSVLEAARRKLPRRRRGLLVRPLSAAVLSLAVAAAAPAYDLHFDYTSFENSPGKHFQQAQFNVLNYPSMGGNYMMTSTDRHRPEMVANGNALAQFYNPYCCATGSDYLKNPRPTAIEEADRIHAYTMNNSTNNGPRPEWLILNEISPSLWQQNPGAPSLSEFRTWAIDSVTRLTDVYGYKVIILSPYQQLGSTQNAPSWQALANKAYIGIEAYLDGDEVWKGGTDYASRVAYAQGRYQAAKNSYLNVGVPAEKLFVIEHVGNTVAGTKWGRGGIPTADWDQVLMIRQDALYNVNFAGFLTYAWGGNNMNITEAEQIQHEYYYRTRLTLASEQPQWLSDSAINVNGTTIPLSWSQFLNWKGGVPNIAGAEANFWRTLTANRTITLDGNKTVGKITFDSPFSYTISPGTGGSLVFNNAGSPATLTSSQGNHTIGVGVQLANGLNAAINTGTFTITGSVTGAGGLTKSGAGTLALNAANSYSGDTTVEAGTLRINSATLPNLADVYLSSGATLSLNFSGSPDVIDSLYINGVSQVAGVWGGAASGATFISPLLAGTGTLQVTTFVPPPIVGDYNVDGRVDAADYIVWRIRVGAASIPNRDPMNAGLIGEDDYHSWRARIGQSAGGGTALGGSSTPAVPEPPGWGIALAAIVGLSRHRRGYSSPISTSAMDHSGSISA